MGALFAISREKGTYAESSGFLRVSLSYLGRDVLHDIHLVRPVEHSLSRRALVP